MSQAHQGHGARTPRHYQCRGVYWNLGVPALYEEAVRRREALISVDGPLVCRTGG